MFQIATLRHAVRRLSTHAIKGNLTKLISLAIAGGAALPVGSAMAQTQTPFVCDSRMYLAQDVPTALYRFDATQNPFVVSPVGAPSSLNYNAIALNPVDRFIYGLSGTSLLRIGAGGGVVNLGTVSGITGSVAGEFGPGGTFWVVNGANLYGINVNTLTSTRVALTQSIPGADLAWYNSRLWSAGPDGGALYEINPTTGAVITHGSTGVTGAFGGMFGATNGIFGSNNSGGFYQFDPVTGKATLISSLQGSSNNDGAKCSTTPLEFPADLKITKDDGITSYSAGQVVTYSIVVSNAGPFGAMGARISDPLPAGITNANWTCGGATGGAFCGAASGTGGINTTANLPAGASVTYTLAMTIPDDFTGDLVNTATVTPPSGTPDPNTSNNSATDTDTFTPSSVTVKKELIRESMTANNVAQPGEVLTYRVTITHTGGGAYKNFDFIENIPNGATMTRVSGANGFTSPVSGASTVQLTVPEVPVGSAAEVEIDLTVAAPIPLGVSQIRNFISGGDVPANCTTCSVTTPTPPYMPNSPDTVSCATSGAFFNTAYDGAGGQKASGYDNYWQVALTTASVTGAPPASLTWGGATVVTNPPAVYMTSPFGNANWISNSSTAIHPTATAYDIFYRYQFNLDPAVSPSSLDLKMNFYADNSVYQVWVNGVAQNIRSNYGASDPYFYQGFSATGGATGSMKGNWRAGLNTIVVHVKSGEPRQAFMAQMTSEAICQPKLTLRKEVINDQKGTAVPTEFVLRATGKAPLTNSIQGFMGNPAITNASVPAGSYDLAEDNKPGYLASAYSCSVDGGAAQSLATGAALALANGQNAICTIVNDDQNPKLTLKKTGTLNDTDGDGLIDPGETITYSFRVENTGDVPLTNVTVEDALLAGAGVSVTPGPQTVQPGGVVVFTATYTPTQAEIDAGEVTNTATATGTPTVGEPVESDPDTAVVPPDRTPGLTIEKIGTLNDLDGDGLIDPGETITYAFVVTNTGAVTLSDVTVEDPLVTVDEGPQTLAPGGKFTFHGTYTPSQTDINSGNVVNTARATGTPPSGEPFTSDPDTVTVPPDQTPRLTIDKTGVLQDQDGDGLVDAGEQIVYSFLVKNTGNVTLTDVTVNDSLLLAEGISVTPGPQTLAPGEEATFTATYTATQDKIDAGRVTNTATATGNTPSGTPYESNPDTEVVPPDQTPGLTIDKKGTLNDTNGNALVDPGESITYTFLVRNSGAVTLTDVTVNDPMLAKAGVTVTPGPQTLAPNGSVTFSVTYTPSQEEIDSGQVTNTATATGKTPTGTPVESEPDTELVPPARNAGLSIKKTGTLNDKDGDGLIDPDETISYSFLVTNTGAVTLSNVTVNDSKVTVIEGPQTLAPGESFTFTAAPYTSSTQEIDAGKVENTATATGTAPDGGSVESDPDTAIVPPDRAAGLALEKTGTLNDLDGDNLIDLGESITYTFIVRNTGNVTLTNVTVDDAMLAGAGVSLSPGPQTLAPGGTATFTATYEPQQNDIDAGTVTNTATAKGNNPDGEPVESTPDTAIVPPDRTPGLTIDKVGTLQDQDGDGLVDLGETISYTFLVKNTGKVTLKDVTVEDAKVTVIEGPQTLAPGGTFTFHANYTPVQEEIDAGQVVNTAIATGTPPSGPPVKSEPDTELVPPDLVPGLTIDKEGALNDSNGNGLLDLGETISYSFLVRNTGSVTLKNVTVNDPLVQVTEEPQTLGPRGTFTFHGTYTPTQADIDAGKVENTATATGIPPSGGVVESAPDTVIITADTTSGLTIDKQGELNDLNGNNVADVGEQINYTFIVKNTGKVTMTNVSIDDPMLAKNGVQISPASIPTLAPGAQATFTATYTVVQSDVDGGKVENSATGTGTPPTGELVISPPGTVIVPPDQAPGLQIRKTGQLNDLDGDNLVDEGETITYTFVVKNTGKVTMTDVRVDDPMLAKYGTAISPASVATLAPGAEATFTATYTAVQADIDGGKVENTATGTGTPPTGVPIVSPPDTVVVPPDQTSGMTIEKTGTLNDKDGDGLLDQGETISYSFLVRNTGNVTLTNVTVNDPLLTNAGIAVTPGPQTLAPGGTATFTATYQPTQADIDAGKVENTATGTGTPPTGVPIVSPPDTVVVPPDQTSGMTIEKTGTLNDKDGDGLLDQGESISYSFLVRNTGNVTLTNVTVNDPLLANAGIAVTPGPQTLAPGASVTFTATYEPTQAEIDAGKVENTATGTGTPPTGVPIVSPPDTVVVPPDETASMTIDKQAELDDRNGNGLIDPGESIAYTFVVKNTGAVTLSNVSVDDPLLANAGVAIEPASVASLAPGAEATFRATYQPTQADIEAGAVTNTATGTGTPPTGVPIVSPPDKVVVPPVELSRLEIEKTGKFNDNDNNGYASLGDTITYSFKITNTGGQVIQNVSPVDEGPTFNGKTASGKLSAYMPENATLQPHGVQVFTATYALTQEDIDNAAGVTDGMVNSATVEGTVEGGGSVPSTTSTSNITIPPAKPADITIIKQAGLRQIKRGEKAPFTIRVTNHSTGNAGFISVTDVMPSGFRYVDGSATVDGVAATPVINGQRVRFDNVALGPNAEVVIRLQMLALSSAGPGKHTNKATVTGSDGNRLAPEARADIEIAIEPVFDCGDIVGKVFDDLNRNGYQDEGEPGLPGVRIATVRGSLVTTDKHGRFHVACADLPDNRIGSNFIMKLDTRTLPAGYRLTTENPRVIRLTAGKMSKLNFGASIGRVVRLDLTDAAFEPGTATLKPKWQKGIDRLIEALETEPSTLRIGYGAASDAKLARERIEAIEKDIAERWKSVRGRYELTIETRVEAGQ
ncbi:putative repeat protein (TIGR01451 family) [Ochrobactrum sp. RH1CCR137]|nr:MULTISPECIES: choice-of-anchor D domain-containing protein [unclassified Ochrobactrum]MBA8845970.1 putative repeat protein (TIGR01451 family) [Ochrobactrum sp. RH1CCR137]MBA8857692.1 putative repeat protein (TIGR01451 family) [Ochrobactrum sp. RH1CCR134]